MKKEQTKNFGAYLDRTIKIIKHNYTKAFKEAGLDLTTEQWVILDSLYEKDGVSQNDLAQGSFKNAPTVSRIIDLLCKKGITIRKAANEDRRKHNIHLTSVGKNIYKKALPIVIELRTKGWNGLNDTDYNDLVRILDQVFSNFEDVV